MLTKRRAVCVVVDGCGVGGIGADEQPTPGSKTPSTLQSIASATGAFTLPFLERLGLGNLVELPGVPPASVPLASFGRARPCHFGADTYLGHQELMGTIPPAPVRQLMIDIGDGVLKALRAAGHLADYAPDAPVLVVDGAIVVADNVEAQSGFNINVTASLDEVGWAHLESVGYLVRDAVLVGRVIVVGGRGFRVADILRHMVWRDARHVGIDEPALGVYDQHYRCRHIGSGVDVRRQAPSIAKAAGLPVALIGKAADVVNCDSADIKNNVIATDGVFDALDAALGRLAVGVIVANIQESDLAGHQQDPVRWRTVLETIDRRLTRLAPRLGGRDLLLISADHGNDPAIGHSGHTREEVPVLAYRVGVAGVDLGVRSTTADVGASICQWLGLASTQDGTPLPS